MLPFVWRQTIKTSCCVPPRRVHLFNRNVHQMVPSNGDRVVVAMSGGVDSSVAAKILADQDYDLSAVFMRNWDTRDESASDTGCEWEKDWEDVQLVCRMLNIPCQMIDLSIEYWTRVFEPSLKAWEAGETPNPDVWCNREVKFGALVDRLAAHPKFSDASWLATGHYARKSWSTPSSASASPRPKLLRARDSHKDQTYYLSSISEQSLSRTLFPLGDLTKPEVRALAQKNALPTSERQESMGICFVGQKRKFHEFISQYIPPNPGRIIDLTTGVCIGTHEGLWTYTIGQGAKIRGMRQRMFVAQKNASSNTIYVVPGSCHDALYCDALRVHNWQWIWSDNPPAELTTPGYLRARMKFRHVMPDIPCSVRRDGESILISFVEPQKAVAPGQIATVWDGDWCLGCGTIVSTTNEKAHHGQSIQP